jgi:hypothetical protein
VFLASDFFHPYQFNTFNLAAFNIRTQSLNKVLYWFAEIVDSYLAGYALDSKCVRRPLRARIAVGVLFLLVSVVWSGAYVWQRSELDKTEGGAVKKDLTDRGYVGPMLLYLVFGLLAAIWQTRLYW